MSSGGNYLVDAFTIRGPYYIFLDNVYNRFIPHLANNELDENLSRELISILDRKIGKVYSDALLYLRYIRNVLTHSFKTISRKQLKLILQHCDILEKLQEYNIDISPLLELKSKVRKELRLRYIKPLKDYN